MKDAVLVILNCIFFDKKEILEFLANILIVMFNEEDSKMKHILVGATGIIAGIMLFGMTWIAVAIYTTRGGEYGRFADALSAIGYFPIFISILLVVTGICFITMAFNKYLVEK